jgi:hypothetical protein
MQKQKKHYESFAMKLNVGWKKWSSCKDFLIVIKILRRCIEHMHVKRLNVEGETHKSRH